jgi:hypothetical protein
MLHLVLALDPTGERFSVLLGLLLAILTLLGAMIRAGWKGVNVVIGQLEATQDNTAAIHELTEAMKEQAARISALEQRGHR